MADNALANATAALPISRADAVRRVEELLVRVGIVNGDDSWPYRVGKVVIVGSYLTARSGWATSMWPSDWTVGESLPSTGPKLCWPGRKQQHSEGAAFGA